MTNIIAYIVLILAVILGTAANGFVKGADGFTLLIPSLLTAITIVGCMFIIYCYENHPSWNYLCLACRSMYSSYNFCRNI